MKPTDSGKHGVPYIAQVRLQQHVLLDRAHQVLEVGRYEHLASGALGEI
jgi:hypothetical protein